MPDDRQIVAAEQTIPLSQINAGRYPEMMLGYNLTLAVQKLQDAMKTADLIADPNDIMVTIRVETIARPRTPGP